MEVKELKESFPEILPAVEVCFQLSLFFCSFGLIKNILYQELVSEKRILVVRTKDGVPKFLYPDESKMYISMSQGNLVKLKPISLQPTLSPKFNFFIEHKTLWDQVQVPEHLFLVKELERAGLKRMQVLTEESSDKRKKGTEGKRKRSNKRMRITNVHLGLDLRKDIAGQEVASESKKS